MVNSCTLIRFHSLALALLALSAWPSHVWASDFFEAAFLKASGGRPCYARSYDAAHLASHPEQTVRAIEINMERENASDIPNSPQRFELGFGLMVKKSDQWFTGVAICSASAEAGDCFIEGDGGRFRLTAPDATTIKLETGSYGIALEGETDFVQIEGNKGDDRVFLLKLEPRGVCDAATPEPPPPQP